MRFRDSSNQKFYQTRNLDVQAVMRGDRVQLENDKELLIKSAVLCVKRYFDIEKRFPEYAGVANLESTGDSMSESASSPSSAASPNPVFEQGSPNPSLQSPPTYGAGDRVPHLSAGQRMWSSSDASYSSTGSDDDRAKQFQGYVPGSYDSYTASGNSLTTDMAAMQIKEERPPTAQPVLQAPPAAEPSPIRERASSFDFGM